MYPEKPLPTIPIEESMSYLPFGYLRASNAGAAIFASEDAARSVGNASQRVNPVIPIGHNRAL
jgi:hypothetical protein